MCRYAAVVIFSFFAVILTVSLGNAMVGVTRTPPFTLPFNIGAMLYFLCASGSRNFILGTKAPALPSRLSGSGAEGVGYLLSWDDQGYFDDGGEVVKAVFRGISQVFLSDDYEVL
jgi:urea transporter